ncbi:conserved hypothetical protein, partial [Ricinus communis]
MIVDLEANFDVRRRTVQADIQVGGAAWTVQADLAGGVFRHHAHHLGREPLDADGAAVDVALDIAAVFLDARRIGVDAHVFGNRMAPAKFQQRRPRAFFFVIRAAAGHAVQHATGGALQAGLI